MNPVWFTCGDTARLSGSIMSPDFSWKCPLLSPPLLPYMHHPPLSRLHQPRFPQHTHHLRQSAAVTGSRTVTNDAGSQSNTYQRAGNTQARQWLAWNGNVSHSVGARSWSEILAVGEMAADTRIPVWAGLWRSDFHYISFCAEGDIKIHFSLLERFTQEPLDFLFLLLLYLFSVFNTFACRLCFNQGRHRL